MISCRAGFSSTNSEHVQRTGRDRKWTFLYPAQKLVIFSSLLKFNLHLKGKEKWHKLKVICIYYESDSITKINTRIKGFPEKKLIPFPLLKAIDQHYKEKKWSLKSLQKATLPEVAISCAPTVLNGSSS